MTKNSNTGYDNTGKYNTGDSNAGEFNTGYRNTGNWNTGDWNTGNRSSGRLCTMDGQYLLFNKACTPEQYHDIPNWLHFNLSQWIDESSMTDQEKLKNPSYQTSGGYLKKLDYHTAAREAWNNATENEKEQTRNLANFDDNIFQEIFGFSALEDK